MNSIYPQIMVAISSKTQPKHSVFYSRTSKGNQLQLPRRADHSSKQSPWAGVLCCGSPTSNPQLAQGWSPLGGNRHCARGWTLCPDQQSSGGRLLRIVQNIMLPNRLFKIIMFILEKRKKYKKVDAFLQTNRILNRILTASVQANMALLR